MSRWIQFVKEWANNNNISYGCALSNEDMKKAYHKKYLTKKYEKEQQQKEMEQMGKEYVRSQVVRTAEKEQQSIKKLIKKLYIGELKDNEYYYLDPKKVVGIGDNGERYIYPHLYRFAAECLSGKDFNSKITQNKYTALNKEFPEQSIEKSLIGLADVIRINLSHHPSTISVSSFLEQDVIKYNVRL